MGPNAVRVMVIEPLYGSSFTNASAGDPEGMDTTNAWQGKPNWWLKVHRSEVGKLMIIEDAPPAVEDAASETEDGSESAAAEDESSPPPRRGKDSRQALDLGSI
jgi:hypothetical protein